MATNTSDFFTFSKTAGTAKNLQKPLETMLILIVGSVFPNPVSNSGAFRVPAKTSYGMIIDIAIIDIAYTM